MAWLEMAKRMEIHYRKAQVRMAEKILGAILHTTNAKAGAQTLERFRQDWQDLQRQSTHFMIDRSGAIGQFRSTEDMAWHLGEPSRHYIGIEHITTAPDPLEVAQKIASAKLIAELSRPLKFPIVILEKRMATGVGVHRQFEIGNPCGGGVFVDANRDAEGGIEILETFLVILTTASILGRWEVRIDDLTLHYMFEPNGRVRRRLATSNEAFAFGGWDLEFNSGNVRIWWPTGLEWWRLPPLPPRGTEPGSCRWCLVWPVSTWSKADCSKKALAQGRRRARHAFSENCLMR